MVNTLDVLSLGAGVQSTTLFLMSCRGLLPKLDAAVFADTGWEPKAVYENVNWLQRQGEVAGIPLYVATCGRSIREDAIVNMVRGTRAKGQRHASMPLFTLSSSGERGMIKRQCSKEYKGQPVDQFIRRTLLGLAPGRSAPPGSVNQWFGFSSDEMRRVRQNRERWRCFMYPLVNLPHAMLSKPYSRTACAEWLAEHYPGREFPRSSCIGCPFRNNRSWRMMKRKQPTEFADAVEVDRALRKCGGMRGDCFLHFSCVPLEVANLDEDQGELFRDECLGVCWT
jgi:hypothetical protein